MDELYLDLAGIPILVKSADFGDLRFLEEYVSGSKLPEHCFLAQLVDALDQPDGTPICSQAALRVYRTEGRLRIYHGPVGEDTTGAYLCAVRGDETWVLQFLREKMPYAITGKQLLNAMDLPHLLTIHDGFLLHASFIEHAGGAILFTAPSETGKSTQAQLWCDHAGAELVNGDRAAVRIMGGRIFACGTPFSGSSPVHRNVILPLKAIVYLSQAPENAITKLRGVRAFHRVWEGCTVNTWDREDVEKATRTVSEVISRIPVYHLACTPDARAVELLKHTMEVES